MITKQVEDCISWEFEEFLFNDKVYQSSKRILNECIVIENKIDKFIHTRNEREKQLRDIFVRHYKQYTPQDIC